MTSSLTRFLQTAPFNLRRLLHQVRTPQKSSGPVLCTEKIESKEQYKERQARMQKEFARRERLENALAGKAEVIATSGHCAVCHADMSFHSDYAYALIDSTGKPKPNWRERVVCPSCELNNRMRAVIQFFQESCQPDQKSKIYLTEQTTPLFAWFKLHYSGSVGSEYLGDSIAFGGADQRGIRNESLTRLTFPDASFDFLMSFDVFEHIPDYQAAFRECYRVLKPGGAMIFTVPFVHDAAAHTVRARLLPNGEVQHVLPAEYHGDPLAQAGCLCYYHFGWDMLEDLRQIGFDAAAAHFYWSEELGYLGIDQLLFMAKRGNS